MRRLNKISGVKYQYKGTRYTVGYKAQYDPKNGLHHVTIGVFRYYKTNLGTGYQFLSVYHGSGWNLDIATQLAVRGVDCQENYYGLKKIMYKHLRKYIQKKVSEEQFSIMHHALGMPRARFGKPYRNYYNASPIWNITNLIEKGYMKEYCSSIPLCGDSKMYYVTLAGMEIVLGKVYVKKHKKELEKL